MTLPYFHDGVQTLRSRVAAAAFELAQELARSPRPSEVATRAQLDLDAVVETLARQPLVPSPGTDAAA